VGVSAGAAFALLFLAAAPDAERFRLANENARAADYPKAIAGYAELAASGAESASLYWNWAQAAAARGATGEALWGLLRARELEPGDRAVEREIGRVREAANLDAAEIAPEPLAVLGRWCRRLHLALLAVGLALASVVVHVSARALSRSGRLPALGLSLLGLAALLGALPLAASFARPTGVVVRRGAPLLDAASPTAGTLGALREGEVVPILQDVGGFLRVEDSSGARGWASAEDVRCLERAPAAGAAERQ
jgi:hypothetical protein